MTLAVDVSCVDAGGDVVKIMDEAEKAGVRLKVSILTVGNDFLRQMLEEAIGRNAPRGGGFNFDGKLRVFCEFRLCDESGVEQRTTVNLIVGLQDMLERHAPMEFHVAAGRAVMVAWESTICLTDVVGTW